MHLSFHTCPKTDCYGSRKWQTARAQTHFENPHTVCSEFLFLLFSTFALGCTLSSWNIRCWHPTKCLDSNTIIYILYIMNPKYESDRFYQEKRMSCADYKMIQKYRFYTHTHTHTHKTRLENIRTFSKFMLCGFRNKSDWTSPILIKW